MRSFLQNLTLRSPAPEELIESVSQALGRQLPPEYVEFLRFGNGAEGFVGPLEYVMLWPVDELLKMNDAYQVTRFAPGFLLFGSDGSGEAYGFDTEVTPWSIVRIPFVGMSRESAIFISNSFWAFLRHLEQTES